VADDKPSDPDPSPDDAGTPVPKGHPRGLYVLFSAEMWERFCYYTMRGLLTLYLIKALGQGDIQAFAIYGAYTALVYAAPMIGGQIADKILGYRRAVILGGVMMAIGEFMICLGFEDAMYLGMGVIIVGNGYFKANISTMVGKLYREGDPRRDSGFTIFYMGINLGAVGATLIGAPIGEGLAGTSMGNAGWLVGFGLAGVGMIAGLGVFLLGRNKLEGKGEPPNLQWLTEPWIMGLSRQTVTIILSFAVVPVLYVLLQHKNLVDTLLVVAAAVVIFQLLKASIGEGPVARDRIIVLMLLMLFNIVFWSFFEQAGSSLTLFADRNVDRTVLGFEMPASQTQFFNPAFIILFGSVFSVMWVKLDERKLNPNIPAKFGLGLVQLGAGFLALKVGATMAGPDAQVPLLFLVLMYMLHTTGELFLSPIGLSMVTKLAPAKMTGQVMGAWFLSWAFANSAAAALAQLTGAPSEGGAGPITAMVDAATTMVTPPPGALEALVDGGAKMLTTAHWDEVFQETQKGLDQYVEVFTTMGLVACGIGVFLLLLAKPLDKMMHGVK
jgi:proton-dependent oligopeptide transporter, POT family